MNLLVFLSDRCNMACDYCFLSLNSHPSTILSADDAVRAVDAHAERWGARARVTILGGEPLLHPELALTVARRARKAGAKTTLVTNGARAEPEIVAELTAHGAEIAVSLDGRAESHDRHRRALGGGPTHAAVTAALGRLPAASLRVNLVISEDTVGAFLSNIEWLRASGFSRLSFHADAARPWSEAGLRALETALAGFTRYARLLDAAGPDAVTFWHLDSYRSALSGPPADEGDLFLGADGRYYASDAWLSRPYGAGLEGAVGDVRSGPDWDARREMLAAIDADLGRALADAPYYTWPRETWLLAKLAGRDPAAAARAFRRADSILGDALARRAREACA